MRIRALVPVLCLCLLGIPASAQGADQIGASFPKGFPVIVDASLGTPVLGFGGRDASRVRR